MSLSTQGACTGKKKAGGMWGMAVDRAIQVFSIASWCPTTVEGEIETVDKVKSVVDGS